MLSVCCRIGWEGHMLIMYINYQCGSGFLCIMYWWDKVKVESESWKWKLMWKLKVKVKSGDDEKDGKQIEDLKTLPQIAEPPLKGRFRKQISRSRQEKTKRNSRASPCFKRLFKKRNKKKNRRKTFKHYWTEFICRL